MVKKYKKIILVIIGLLLMLTMFVGVKYLMQSKSKKLPESKLKELNKTKTFAIMVQTGDGYEEYTSEDDTWPGEGYKFKEAKCTDNNGALVDSAVTFADGKVTLKSNKTIYCTLYFDIYKKTMADILRDKTNCLTEDLVYGLYRCQGNSIYDKETKEKTDTVNNNYICLGSDCSELSDDMYRIIGITEEGEMKVIKNWAIEETVQWDETGDDIQWPDSNIYSYLNTDFYQTLPIELKEKILNVSWNYGDVTSPDVDVDSQNIFTPEELSKYYELDDAISGNDGSELTDDQKREKIKEVTKMYSEALAKRENELTDNIPANIGLLNITDYCSSFESNGTYNCMTSFYSESLNESTNEDYGLTWLTPEGINNDEVIMSRLAYTKNSGVLSYMINGKGYLRCLGFDFVSYTRPVFFLTSDIELTDDGEGTIENPFRVVGISEIE